MIENDTMTKLSPIEKEFLKELGHPEMPDETYRIVQNNTHGIIAIDSEADLNEKHEVVMRADVMMLKKSSQNTAIYYQWETQIPPAGAKMETLSSDGTGIRD